MHFALHHSCMYYGAYQITQTKTSMAKTTFYRHHKIKSWSWNFGLGLARAKSQSLGLAHKVLVLILVLSQKSCQHHWQRVTILLRIVTFNHVEIMSFWSQCSVQFPYSPPILVPMEPKQNDLGAPYSTMHISSSDQSRLLENRSWNLREL